MVTIMVSAHTWEFPTLTWVPEQEVEWLEEKGRGVILVKERLITS